MKTTSSPPKTAVITGATSGLGYSAALALTQVGFRVIAVGRDRARGQKLVDASHGSIQFVAADFFALTDVIRSGRELAALAPSLDLLVNNAGGSFQKQVRTIDGLERTFALNVAAPFALTNALLPSLATAKGRVVNIVTGISDGAKASLETLVGDKASAGPSSYIRSKLALLALTQAQSKQFSAEGVTAVALHPGIIPGTSFGQEMPKAMLAVGGFMAKLFGFASSLEQAAARYVAIGTGPVESGGYYKEGKLSAAPHFLGDGTFSKQLWEALEKLAPKT
jgi:NAD(P)-dependent dehydrogenase (short-subunit alcohol dehydrogenase family)